MEEMTRLFNLDFQLLHDVVLMAIAVFFLFMMMSKLLLILSERCSPTDGKRLPESCRMPRMTKRCSGVEGGL